MSVDLEHERFNTNAVTLWEHERASLGNIYQKPQPDQLEQLRQQVDADRIIRYQTAKHERRIAARQRWERAMQAQGHRIHGGLHHSQENT